jgi:hypothetical protein
VRRSTGECEPDSDDGDDETDEPPPDIIERSMALRWEVDRMSSGNADSSEGRRRCDPRTCMPDDVDMMWPPPDEGLAEVAVAVATALVSAGCEMMDSSEGKADDDAQLLERLRCSTFRRVPDPGESGAFDSFLSSSSSSDVLCLISRRATNAHGMLGPGVRNV